jgi:hypothetical protein
VYPGSSTLTDPSIPQVVAKGWYSAFDKMDINVSASYVREHLAGVLRHMAKVDPELLTNSAKLAALYHRFRLTLVGGPAVIVGEASKMRMECNEDCPVCIGECDEVSAITLPCGHTYHEHCILAWLTRVPTCPTCRAECDPSAVFGIARIESDTNRAYMLMNMLLGERLDIDCHQCMVAPTEFFEGINLSMCEPCEVHRYGPVQAVLLNASDVDNPSFPPDLSQPEVYVAGLSIYDAIDREAIVEVLKGVGIDLVQDDVYVFQCGCRNTFETSKSPSLEFYRMMTLPKVCTDADDDTWF